jgi:hypothetical protein
MNNQNRITILLTLLLSSAVFGSPIFNKIKCTNSSDGKAQVINNVLECDLQASFYDQNFLLKQSFGITKAIILYSNIRLNISPLMLMRILGENTIRLPSHLAYLKIILKDGADNEQILVISMVIKIILKKTGSLCDFRFIDFKPNISDFKSPHLPDWLSKGIEKIINNNQKLRQEILKLANTSVIQARRELELCKK